MIPRPGPHPSLFAKYLGGLGATPPFPTDMRGKAAPYGKAL